MIYLIRHGKTDANRNRYAGRENISLNKIGKQQANSLSNSLRDCSITHIFCSPLNRAIETATPLSIDHELEIQLRPQLLEIDFGNMQGSNKTEYQLNLRKTHLYTPIPGGESLQDVWQRIASLSKEVRDLVKADGRVAIIAHYWTNRMLHGHLSGHTLEETATDNSYKPQTGSYFKIDVEI